MCDRVEAARHPAHHRQTGLSGGARQAAARLRPVGRVIAASYDRDGEQLEQLDPSLRKETSGRLGDLAQCRGEAHILGQQEPTAQLQQLGLGTRTSIVVRLLDGGGRSG